MMDILSEIFANKRIEVQARQRVLPLEELRRQAEAAPAPADLIRTIRQAATSPALIAEVKFHSPSRGRLVKKPDPVKLTSIYAQNEAAGISVLTDEKYFRGRLEYLHLIHTALPQIPLLQKDFIFDPYQLYEARAAGASSVLLIAAYLHADLLTDLHALALSLGLAPLVEVHNLAELEAALSLPKLQMLGVNNRNLHTFKVDLRICLSLRSQVPNEVCFVAESGIRDQKDIRTLADAKVDAVLIGEALVTADDPSTKIKGLFGEKVTNPGAA